MNDIQNSYRSPLAERRPDFSFTLRQLLCAVLSFGAFLVFVRIAYVNRSSLLVWPGVVSLGLSVGLLTQRYTISLSVVVLLALASAMTSNIMWSGGFPFGEVQVTIVDREGMALDNVKMTVHRVRSGKPAYGYPIAEYTSQPLISDTQGLITCHQTLPGIQFGGSTWYLFWCIPIGARGPEFDVCFEHPTQGRMNVSLWQLFETDSKWDDDDIPTTTFSVNGRAMEMPVYERTFVFRRYR